jgi:hypothetical protein
MYTHVQAITKDTLTPLVRKAMSDPSATVHNWQLEQIYGGIGGGIGGTALYRLHGQTRQGQSWSLILKILYERPGESIGAPYYWKREYELYRSGLLNRLPDTGLTPPTCYGTEERPGAAWIWLEPIESVDRKWTLDDYQTVAHRLGRFNGAYLTGLEIPDYDWLNHHWHCRIAQALTATFDQLDDYLQHPLARRTLPIEEKATILNIWRDVNRFCDTLARFPQTLCHLDAFRRNLFYRENGMVLIDWALVGRGAIGEELVALVAVTLYFNELDISQSAALDTAVFAGYIAGLRDVGWTGDPQIARLGYLCAMVLRGLVGVQQDIRILLDEANYPMTQRIFGMEIEALADHFARVRRFRLIQMAAEARQLLHRGKARLTHLTKDN